MTGWKEIDIVRNKSRRAKIDGDRRMVEGAYPNDVIVAFAREVENGADPKETARRMEIGGHGFSRSTLIRLARQGELRPSTMEFVPAILLHPAHNDVERRGIK